MKDLKNWDKYDHITIVATKDKNHRDMIEIYGIDAKREEEDSVMFLTTVEKKSRIEQVGEDTIYRWTNKKSHA